MEIVKAVDYGVAPEIPVKGVSSIEQISPGQVRISYYVVHKGNAGEPEARTVVHLVWDRMELLSVIPIFQLVKAEIETGAMALDGPLRLVLAN